MVEWNGVVNLSSPAATEMYTVVIDFDTAFRIPLPAEQAFALLTDLERVAPAMPGVTIEGREGDDLVATMKVKVGPVTAQYRLRTSMVSEDAAQLTAALRAGGREMRGQGSVEATVTATLTPETDGTAVHLHTDATVTGRVAQFGRGAMQDIADRMLRQFAENLARDLISEHSGSS